MWRIRREGWSWDPENVPVVVDDSGCNHNEDINFRFTGFTLSGKVVGAVGGESCSVKNGGPSNVNVELLSPSDDLISFVVTSSTGSYLFTNIIPGNIIELTNYLYVIRIKQKIYSSSLDMRKIQIHASHPDLKVEVKGSTEGNPILGVHIYLYSDDVVELDCPQGSGDATGQRKPLCHAVSDADGCSRSNHYLVVFLFVICAHYELVPFYKGENTVFDVSPPVVSVSVEHQHVTVPQKFQVTGFSVGGRVVDGDGMGVEGVKIIVDGHERSTTDKEGYYKLDQVTSNQYTIEARKEHYKFNSLKEYMVLPNMASVAEIKAVSYDVCGVVRMVNNGHKAKVTLTLGPENVKPQVRQTDGSGIFCFEVPPGEYRLSAFAATPESASGLLFLPPYIDVMVKNPLLDIEFSQALVNVLGSVTCKERCGPSVSVSLVRLAGKHNEERKSISLTEQSDEFLFPNVLPGKYRLEVKHGSPEAMHSEDNWCWEQGFIDVDVGAEDVKGIVFIQKAHLSERREVSSQRTKSRSSLNSADDAFELPNNIIVDILNSGAVLLMVLVTNDGCQAPIPMFSGHPGLYIEGSVSPPLSGVYVKIIAEEDSCTTPLKKDETALETTTGIDEGDANEPIPPVLLSLSGDDGYRNNSKSGAGGTFLFDNLFPGIFYLRPLLKEYAFSPPAQAIELGSGDSREVTFQATRIAYSATGVIKLLSGQPKEGVGVEARSESKGYYEETVTDSSGSYRLRGLIPDTAYVIKVVEKHGLGANRIERASPESVTVKVGSEDIRALNFIVFEQPEMTILSCHVEGKRMEEFHSHLLVKNLPKGKHLLQLRSSLQSSNLKFESDVIEVDLDKTAQIHVGPLRYNFEEDHQKQDLTPAPVFPLVVGVSVIALFISMPRLKDLYQATTGIPAPGFMTTAKKEPRKSAVEKRHIEDPSHIRNTSRFKF
ncbi:hypothetical protein GH714_004655 [Hevea brasiliensis]|uniref:Carbohydrate-binding-like fold protein n=1 Tax=Hevea brasiliensis TaxID=3981 RepID=A0A6A6M7J5_HEVBR|nr:hypothetical protein GH714_004655 [Hevea brasiliensis]